MFGLFKRAPKFDDEKQSKFIDAVASMLEMQRLFVKEASIEDAQGRVNRKAIGYIYGFVDAALRTIGQDMADAAVGVPITFSVLNRLYPGRARDYVEFLFDHLGKDRVVMLGVMTGGQQYIDYAKKAGPGVPMKFGIFLSEGDPR